MCDVVILFLHLIVTVVRLARPGGLRSRAGGDSSGSSGPYAENAWTARTVRRFCSDFKVLTEC